MEEDAAPEAAEEKTEGAQRTEQQRGQDGAAQAEQVKTEADRSGHYSRKRPYEENRSYGYYEHREDKRCVHFKL